MFEMEWHGRRVALKASNGRYVCMKKNGQLAAISDFVGEHSAFCKLGSPPPISASEVPPISFVREEVRSRVFSFTVFGEPWVLSQHLYISNA